MVFSVGVPLAEIEVEYEVRLYTLISIDEIPVTVEVRYCDD